MTDRPAERGSAPDRGFSDTASVRRSSAGRPTTPPPSARRPAPASAQAAAAQATATAPAKKAPAKPGKPAKEPKAGKSGKGRPARPRRARLSLTRIDPWSVMKMSFLLSIALGIVMVVAVLVLWGVLGAAGVWDSINQSVNDIVGDGSTWNITHYLGTSRVLGFTMIVAVVDVVLLTAVSTLGAFLYNMAAALLGGIEVTLSEDQQ
jgi:hypothetical protein